MAANCRPPSLACLHSAFLSIVPRIELHGRVCFRTRSWHDQQEAVAEMVALCWKWFVRLAHQGKDATRFPSVLATFAARGRRFGPAFPTSRANVKRYVSLKSGRSGCSIS